MCYNAFGCRLWRVCVCACVCVCRQSALVSTWCSVWVMGIPCCLHSQARHTSVCRVGLLPSRLHIQNLHSSQNQPLWPKRVFVFSLDVQLTGQTQFYLAFILWVSVLLSEYHVGFSLLLNCKCLPHRSFTFRICRESVCVWGGRGQDWSLIRSIWRAQEPCRNLVRYSCKTNNITSIPKSPSPRWHKLVSWWQA